MYLSELIIDKSMTMNPYEIHQIIWQLFPHMENESRPFLFRIDRERKGKAWRILLQSAVKADPKKLLKGCFIFKEKEFHPHIFEGQLLRFILCANPIKRLLKERCRVPLIREEEQIEWLKKKFALCAEIAKSRVNGKNILYFRKKGKSGKIETITFEGILKVSSPEYLLSFMKQGVGPAKSFGCGLLSLARM